MWGAPAALLGQGQDPAGLYQIELDLQRLRSAIAGREAVLRDWVNVYRALDRIGAEREGRALHSADLDLSRAESRYSAARLLTLPDPCPSCSAATEGDAALAEPVSVSLGTVVLRTVAELRSSFDAHSNVVPGALAHIRSLDQERRRLEAERAWIRQDPEPFTSPPSSSGRPNPDARSLAAEADRLLREGDRASAKLTFDQALRLDPRSVQAYVGRGRLFLLWGELGPAAADFDSALSLAPGQPVVYYYRGLAREGLGFPREAVEDFRAGCEGSVPAACQRLREIAIELEWEGTFAWDRDDLEGARDYFSRAIEVDPRYPDPWFNRALTWEAVREYARAIQDLTAFIQQHAAAEAYAMARPVPVPEPDPEGIAEAHFRIGVNTYRSGAPAQAIPHYDQAIALVRPAAPEKVASYLYWRGRAHHAHWQALGPLGADAREKARSDFRSACTMGDQGACEMLAGMGG